MDIEAAYGLYSEVTRGTKTMPLLKNTPFSTAFCRKHGVTPTSQYIGHCGKYPQFRKAITEEEFQRLMPLYEAAQKAKRPKNPQRAAKARATREANQLRKWRVERIGQLRRWAQFRRTLTPEIRAICPRRPSRVWELFAQNLHNINEAHPTWLQEAITAFADSAARGGIASYWEDTDLNFYQVVCRALSAYRRHQYTDYDAIPKRGLSDCEVAELRREKTIEAMQGEPRRADEA